MKVICVNTINREKLVLNKVYEVTEFYFGYRIIGDSHDPNSFTYPKNLFITLAEYRQLRLRSLLADR
jgi:hypothetical protein